MLRAGRVIISVTIVVHVANHWFKHPTVIY